MIRQAMTIAIALMMLSGCSTKQLVKQNTVVLTPPDVLLNDCRVDYVLDGKGNKIKPRIDRTSEQLGTSGTGTSEKSGTKGEIGTKELSQGIVEALLKNYNNLKNCNNDKNAIREWIKQQKQLYGN